MDAITPAAERSTDAPRHAPRHAPRAKRRATPSSLLAVIARAIADPATDAAKLQVLLHHQREIDREARAEAAMLAAHAAMAAVQAEMAPILRDTPNELFGSKYAPLEAIDAIMRPIYTRHGFCLTFGEDANDGPQLRIGCDLIHGSYVKHYSLEAALDLNGPKGTPNKTPLHALGASASYLRRYLTTLIFNVVMRDEDVDGNTSFTDTPGRLTGAQRGELVRLMRETNTREDAFLRHVAPALSSIDQVPPQDFVRLKNALLNKQNVLRQRAALAKTLDAYDANRNPKGNRE